jgi:cyclopropane-fatty-acyl-phospholipid synthase
MIASKQGPQPTLAGAEGPIAPVTDPTVVACYSVYDYFFPALGFTDLTEGMYEGDPNRPYEDAQARQAESLLDRAGVKAGGRLLDIGCGYGRILRAAEGRGARAWGITVSPEQVRQNVEAGLNARVMDYKRLGPEWDGQFDAVIANGSLEHFVQPADAVAGMDDAIYRHLFATVHRLLDRRTTGARFVTTAIHFRGARPDPNGLLRAPSEFAAGSPEFHWARLGQSFGGWYPVPGQLERCAEGLFRLVDEEDGTEDYRLTSEAWLTTTWHRLCSWRFFGVAWSVLLSFLFYPLHTVRMLQCLLGSESWNWQFRGDKPPTVLLRQTWEKVG